MFGALELRRRRAALIESAGALLTKAHEEQRTLTDAESQEFDGKHAEAAKLLEDIKRIELQEERAKEVVASMEETREVTGRRNGPSNDEAENAQLETRAFRSWMRGGWNALSGDELRMARQRMPTREDIEAAINSLPEAVRAQFRAAQTVTTTGGGYIIAREFQRELDVALLAYGGPREAGRVVVTSTGATLDWPTINDTATKGRLLGINTTVTNTALVYGTIPFEAYKYSSDSVLVPVELAQDSAFDIDSHVREMLAVRLGRITAEHLTTGDGTGKPKGIVTAAVDSTLNVSIAGGGLAYTDFVNLKHKVNRAYRRSPKCAWMMNDTVMGTVEKILDSNGRPIFRPAGDAPGDVDRILGFPAFVNDDMDDDTTATNKPLIFGDMGKYIVRVVRPMVMLRLEERYADDHQIGYFAFERLDGDLVDAGTNPVQFLDMVA